MTSKVLLWLLAYALIANAQQQCYFGPGAKNRGPSSLVPCMDTGQSACCLLGDTCLSGNTCYNFESGDLYQYGCTDITYTDETCPFKCGWDPGRSPWTALEFCLDTPNATDLWVCHAPESCGCDWEYSTSLLVLERRGCKDMGSDARVALWAPSALAPYVSLPSTIGGSTGYYSPTVVDDTSTWVETAVSGYTPDVVTELTTYGEQPSQVVLINSDLEPSASTLPAAKPVSSNLAAATSGSVSTTASGSSSSEGQADSTSPLTSNISSSSTGATSSADGISPAGALSSISSASSAASVSSMGSSSLSSAATANASLSAPSSAPSSSTGLSTGMKAGIGGGAAGLACLILALTIALILLHRRRKQRSHPPEPSTANLPYPHQPPIHQNPHFGEKPDWQAPYPFGSELPAPQYEHQRPGLYHGAPSNTWSDLRDDASYVTGPESPPLSELPSAHGLHEIGSDGAQKSGRY